MDDLAISKNSIHPEQTEIIMYQTEDGLTKIDVRMENETVWLTQAQMAELFQRERSGITKHIKNVFAEGEVDEKSNVKNVHIALRAVRFTRGLNTADTNNGSKISLRAV